jgi:hypothetical protein
MILAVKKEPVAFLRGNCRRIFAKVESFIGQEGLKEWTVVVDVVGCIRRIDQDKI